MTRLFLACLIASLIGGAALALAEPNPMSDGPKPDWLDDAPADASADVAAPADTAPDQVDLSALVAELKLQLEATKTALDALRSADGGKMALWFALLAALTNLVLLGVKTALKLTQRGKRYLSWAALGLGVLVGLFSYYRGSVIEAIVYGAGPPMAVLIQELLALRKKPEAKPA